METSYLFERNEDMLSISFQLVFNYFPFVLISQVAVSHNVPTMTEEWVKSVWEAVLKRGAEEHVSATDKDFLPYHCKPLHGQVVCVSQVDQDTKTELKRLIEENGEQKDEKEELVR